MSKTLILHGHFYQPPRENPDTDMLPIQPSAYPKENWNIRITDECYAANAYSRYLTYNGRIERITNNYEYLSFNFGPTLLQWIRRHREDVYGRIIEADRISLQRNAGHGNAIAQAFNHTILPLDAPGDAETQIAWGIEDFSYHFGRDAEGIWLPESAVNDHVLDAAISMGITFIILSPWQAERVESVPGTWRNLGASPAPYDHPYLLERPGGNLAVFFYHPGLAEGISFGHFLRDADSLYRHIRHITDHDGTRMIHTATDGEIYGHHEPFGDMCLAALIQRVHSDGEFTMTNYGAFLEANPPKLRAVLKGGEEHRGTSWSCSHGVSRWYKDCGCSTGGEAGWNQKWRTPLRKSFDEISSRLNDICVQQLAQLPCETTLPQLLIRYGRVVSGREAPCDFARSVLGSDAAAGDISLLLKLMEGQRLRMYMYTSCGWFFSDISGIETRQNIRFALQAVTLYDPYTQDNLFYLLEDMLHSAKSNMKSQGRGSRMVREIRDSMLPIGVEAACFFVLNRHVTRPEDYVSLYGDFTLISMEKSSLGGDIAEIEKQSTSERYTFTVITEFDRTEGLLIHCRNEYPDDGPFQELTMDMLGSYTVSRLFIWIDQSLERVTDNDLDQIIHDMSYYTGISRQSTYQPDKHFYIANMGTCMRTLNSLFRLGLVISSGEHMELIQALLDFIFQKGGPGEKDTTNRIISGYLDKLTEDIRESSSDNLYRYVKEMLILTRDSGFVPDITRLQNTIYEELNRQLTEGRVSKELSELCMQAGIVVPD